MPENPFTRIVPGNLGNDEKNHHRQHCGRNNNLYQKIHHHLRLRDGCAVNKEILAAPIRIHARPSGGHFEQDAARYAVEQQCVVFSCPPARKKTLRVMPNDDQVDLQ